MYVAFVAGLSAFGLIPRATVEIPGRARRLDRIVGLLRRCRYSFDDLSRVGIDRGPPPTPRFNMPFELGLAVALEGAGASARLVRLRGAPPPDNEVPERPQRDRPVHPRRATGRRRDGPGERAGSDEASADGVPASGDAPDLRAAVVAIRRDLQTGTMFEARAFKELVVAARVSAENRVPSLRRRRGASRRVRRRH